MRTPLRERVELLRHRNITALRLTFYCARRVVNKQGERIWLVNRIVIVQYVRVCNEHKPNVLGGWCSLISIWSDRYLSCLKFCKICIQGEAVVLSFSFVRAVEMKIQSKHWMLRVC